MQEEGVDGQLDPCLVLWHRRSANQGQELRISRLISTWSNCKQGCTRTAKILDCISTNLTADPVTHGLLSGIRRWFAFFSFFSLFLLFFGFIVLSSDARPLSESDDMSQNGIHELEIIARGE